MTRIQSILSELSILKASYTQGDSRYIRGVLKDITMAESYLKSVKLAIEQNKGNRL